jgi:hypothetical protein
LSQCGPNAWAGLLAAIRGSDQRSNLALLGLKRFDEFLSCLSELASLKVASFQLVGDGPIVTVEASYSKRRRRDELPLHPELARLVAEYIGDRPADAQVWPGMSKSFSAKMLRRDLEEARALWIKEAEQDPEEQKRREQSSFLLYQDHAGLFFDFHATRGQFITELARQGVHPKTAQLLARHSTINLTMNTYTHLDKVDLQAAVDSLPVLPTSVPEPAKATGTDDRVVGRCVGGVVGAGRARPRSPASPSTRKSETADDDDGAGPEMARPPGASQHPEAPVSIRGPSRDRTGDDGFAIRCLAAWRRGHGLQRTVISVKTSV